MREFDVIAAIRERNRQLGSSVVIPPGDDLGAVMLPEGGGVVLAGVDQVVGGVHLSHEASPEQFAWKVAARSLSDVAAMAASPVGMVVAAALMPATSSEWTGRFASALHEVCTRFQCPLFGGDIAVLPSSDSAMVLSSTVLASPDPLAGGRLVLRNGARSGDRVCVSGSFGNSMKTDGSGHHLDFTPRIDLARSLHRELGASLTSMIDVSDGLGADLNHLASESGRRMIIDPSRVPRRLGASQEQALCDGEDYELCFTIAADAVLPDSIHGVPLSEVGSVEEGDGVHLLVDGAIVPLVSAGWEHRSRDECSSGGSASGRLAGDE